MAQLTIPRRTFSFSPAEACLEAATVHGKPSKPPANSLFCNKPDTNLHEDLLHRVSPQSQHHVTTDNGRSRCHFSLANAATKVEAFRGLRCSECINIIPCPSVRKRLWNSSWAEHHQEPPFHLRIVDGWQSTLAPIHDSCAVRYEPGSICPGPSTIRTWTTPTRASCRFSAILFGNL